MTCVFEFQEAQEEAGVGAVVVLGVRTGWGEGHWREEPHSGSCSSAVRGLSSFSFLPFLSVVFLLNSSFRISKAIDIHDNQ